MSKKTILNLAFTDSGGAGKASLVFNEMLNESGCKSILVVKESNEKNNNVIVFSKNTEFFLHVLLKKISNKIRHFILSNFFFVQKYFFLDFEPRKNKISSREILNLISFNPDFIFLHWISGFINPELISELEKITKARIIWIMLDNAPLTGGCHFPWSCKGYENSCLNCPAINISFLKQIAHKKLELKKKFIPKNLILLTCSTSDYFRAKKSSVFKENPIHKIFLPVNSDKFIEGNRTFAKNYFSIGLDKKVIFYGASGIENIRKGLKYFIDAILILENKLKSNKVPLDSYAILISGRINENLLSKIQIPIFITGFLDKKNLIKAYQASDVYVSTVIEDSGPLMVNQSIMCGTPVVSFNIGVAVDLVSNDVTGYLSEVYKSELIGSNIYKILSINKLDYLKIRENCRELGLKQFSYKSHILNLNKLLNNDLLTL